MSDAMAEHKVATFAGGCFWCMQPPFDKLKGVKKTVVGYTGGRLENPTYAQVSSGKSGHFEAIQVYYDSDEINYRELLETFWRNVDPENDKGQFCDIGPQYRSAIFVDDSFERAAANESKDKLIHSRKLQAVYTEIVSLNRFYPAEDYHQNYYKKNPIRYKYYRFRCGRDKRLKQLWGSDDVSSD